MKRLVLRIALALIVIPFGAYAAQLPGGGERAPKPQIAVQRSDTLTAFPGLERMLAPDWGAPVPDKAETDTSKLAAVAAYPPSYGIGVGGGDMPEAEPNDAPMNANVVADMPFDCTGTISYGGDWDFIKVNLTAGQPTQIDVYHRIGFFNSPLDPMLYIVAENGSTILYVNDDVSFPTNLNSEVRFSAPYTGAYYIGIRSAVMVGGAGYDYVVSAWTSLNPVFDISNAEVEPNDTTAVADSLVIPGVKIGAMNYAGDADWSVFSADAGTTIVVDVHSVIYRFLMDPVAEVYDAYGHRLCMNDDTDSRDSRVNILIPATGVYFLKITDYASGSGMGYFYIVSVTPQFGTGAPTITQLRFKPAGMLKKVVGTGFDPAGTYVEVDSHVIPAQVSAAKPTTVMKVKPTYPLPPNSVVTTVLQNGRRSNPALYTGS